MRTGLPVEAGTTTPRARPQHAEDGNGAVRPAAGGRAALGCHAAVAAVLASALLVLAAAPDAAAQRAVRFDAADVVVDDRHRFEWLADLDGDGQQDVIGWWWEQDDWRQIDVTGWSRDGAGGLVEEWTFPLTHTFSDDSRPAVKVAVGDLDADGDDDFAVSFLWHVWVYLSNGFDPPTLLVDFDVTSDTGSLRRVADIVMADFDDDGLDDLAILTDFWNEIEIHLTQVSGLPFVEAGTFSTADGKAKPDPVDRQVLFVVEANGDGLPDLMTWSAGNVDLWWIAGGQLAGSTILSHGFPSSATSADTFMPAFGDVDGDSDGDVVVFRDDGQYTLLRRTGADTFALEPAVTGGPATALADVDADGDLDGVCCGSGGTDPVYNSAASNFEIAINDGTGGFAPSFQIGSVGSHHIAGVADMDDDGDVDLVGGRTIYLARGPIVETVQPRVANTSLGVRHVADADDDGDPDLRFGIDGVDRNDGRGGLFAWTPEVPPSPLPAWEFLGPGYPGDYDGDGDVDLLVSLVSGYWPSGLPMFEGHWLLRNGGGGDLYSGGQAAPAGELLSDWDFLYEDEPSRSLLADLDGDGALDLAGQSFTGARPRIFWNNGTGWFGQITDFGTSESVHGAGDFDTDGDHDLLVTYLGPGIRWAQAPRTYDPIDPLDGPYSETSVEHQDVRIGDMDLDGDLDVVVPDGLVDSAPDARFLFHWNDGAGGFGPASNELPGVKFAKNASLTLVDMDGDGRLDMVASPAYRTNGASLVVLNEPGGWAPQPVQAVAPGALVDMDGDGDLDVISDRLVRNERFVAPEAGDRFQDGLGIEAGCNGGAVLGATGPFRVGETITLRGRGLAPDATAIVLASVETLPEPRLVGEAMTPSGAAAALPFPRLGVIGSVATGGDPAVSGSGRFDLSFDVTPALAALGPMRYVALVYEPCSPADPTTSNWLLLDCE